MLLIVLDPFTGGTPRNLTTLVSLCLATAGMANAQAVIMSANVGLFLCDALSLTAPWLVL